MFKDLRSISTTFSDGVFVSVDKQLFHALGQHSGVAVFAGAPFSDYGIPSSIALTDFCECEAENRVDIVAF